MATIVYGIRHKIKRKKTLGVSECPNCRHTVEMVLAREGGYFHICFIPLIPLSGWKVKLCPNCGIVQKFSKQEFKELVKQ